jgi:hypothetical protein
MIYPSREDKSRTGRRLEAKAEAQAAKVKRKKLRVAHLLHFIERTFSA